MKETLFVRYNLRTWPYCTTPLTQQCVIWTCAPCDAVPLRSSVGTPNRLFCVKRSQRRGPCLTTSLGGVCAGQSQRLELRDNLGDPI